MIQQAVQKCIDGHELQEHEIRESVEEIAEGRATPAQMGAFLVAFRQKGETPGEIAAFASALRRYSVRIHPSVSGRLIDTCGTGGDRVKTFNVSTLSALVVAGAGAKVAKHGNRSVTGKCGSADLLEHLGFNLGASPESARESIEKVGVGFLFAPSFHPAMKQVAGVRKELGLRTVFNLMGPLINPAGANSQLVGVYSPEVVGKVAEVFRILGSEEAIVVHALEGMDEISVSGKTRVSWLKEGEVKTVELDPGDFGVEKSRAPFREIGGVEDGARLAVRLLTGEGDPQVSDMVAANSAAALVVAGMADTFGEGSEQARVSLESGAALTKLKDLVRASGGDTSRIEGYAAGR